jgi:hypothetical protein
MNEENNVLDENENVTPHLSMDNSTNVTTPETITNNEKPNWTIEYGLWKDVHGVWHDIHGRWRDHGGNWHGAPYIADEFALIHWFDHAISYIINNVEENATQTETPLTASSTFVPSLHLVINIQTK